MMHTFVSLPLSFCLTFHSYSMLTNIHAPKREVSGKVLCYKQVPMQFLVLCLFDKNRKQQQRQLLYE